MRFTESTEIPASLLIAPPPSSHKKLNIGMYWTLGRTIDNTKFYILILAQVPLTSSQGHRGVRNEKKNLCQLSHSWCGGSLVCCWNLLVWWTSYSIYVSDQYARERTLLKWFFNKLMWTCILISRLISFKLGMPIVTTKLYSMVPV